MSKFQIVSSRTVLRTPIFDVTHDRALGPQGREIERKIVVHPGAVVILAVNEESEVLLIRQYRVPVRRFLWELPAGTMEPGETPLQTAKRELSEETGYRARSWRKLLQFYPSPGFCNERMTAFVARRLAEGEPHPAPHEWIQRRWISSEEALRMIDSGRIQDGKTITALLYAQRRGL